MLDDNSGADVMLLHTVGVQWILANCMLGYRIFSMTACVRQLNYSPIAESLTNLL